MIMEAKSQDLACRVKTQESQWCMSSFSLNPKAWEVGTDGISISPRAEDKVPAQQAGRKQWNFPFQSIFSVQIGYLPFDLWLLSFLPPLTAKRVKWLGRLQVRGEKISHTELLVPCSSNIGWFGVMVLTYLPCVTVLMCFLYYLGLMFPQPHFLISKSVFPFYTGWRLYWFWSSDSQKCGPKSGTLASPEN